MALSVTSNFAISAGYASNNMRSSQTLMGKSINRISSGHKAVNPADDVVSYVAGNKLKGDSKAYSILSTGIQDAAAKLNMADSIYSELENGLLDIKAQAIAYQSVGTSGEGAAELSNAFSNTLEGLKAMNAATYKGTALFGATTLNAFFGVGSSDNFNVAANSVLQFSALSVSALTITDIGAINTALNNLAMYRANIGGNISALEQISNYLADAATSADAAYTAVTEVDMAREMTSYVKSNIQSQASQAMVAQANQSLAQVLNLLQV